MNIFGWIKEIEDVYEKLMDKARQESLEEIDKYKKEQEILLIKIHEKNHQFIDSTINSLEEDLKNGVKIFEKQINSALEDIKKVYSREKDMVANSIIKKFGFDF